MCCKGFNWLVSYTFVQSQLLCHKLFPEIFQSLFICQIVWRTKQRSQEFVCDSSLRWASNMQDKVNHNGLAAGIPGFSKIHDSDSNSDSSIMWFRFQCFENSMIPIPILNSVTLTSIHSDFWSANTQLPIEAIRICGPTQKTQTMYLKYLCTQMKQHYR